MLRILKICDVIVIVHWTQVFDSVLNTTLLRFLLISIKPKPSIKFFVEFPQNRCS